ncbi:16S rRNA (uracil(1498)-N(3))-methyltransferase [Marinospirillum alkaliphilum]|uniref:Ribosomal RNA small subunit methyltransferase E n=1 Tax=Marinospirillum alkaliphilum DSM 21637 TaxID=1122209 RepID=A0A1K1ZGL2_9GAMM|nr:16S rRNA (uracil(1498)-N(3))-methyltransferase [Marinospirillum alkaliphilum]SFX72828.1 RNA methyltransferase, RsmE family [Marinospirillum alkaliphilum DSM 21637]
MNLLLLAASELNDQGQVTLTDRRHQHLRDVHQLRAGSRLQAGVLNGYCGEALVLEHSADFTRIELQALDTPPPAPLPMTLLLALPRPRMLARSLEHLTTLGVKKLVLMQTARVEKSYWQSPELKPEKIHQHLLLGLEQAKDTLLPEVIFQPRFKPFVEDQLPELSHNSLKLLAHPGDYPFCPRGLSEQVTLAIGPEGGFVDFEVDLLQQQGFQPVQLGERILRVETAVTALLARLF